MLNLGIKDYLWHMDLAIEMAEKAYGNDEVPVGAVLVDSSNKVLSSAFNLKEQNQDVTGHAEILCLKEAAEKNKSWRLNGCTLIVTLEPCPMCLSAALQARVKTVVFGAYDLKGGALSLGYHFHQDPRLNHKLDIVGGVRHYQCSKLLSQFFKEKRNYYKTKK